MLDWPDDIGSLLDHLAIDRVDVAGISAGVPYTCAMAWALPARVRAMLIVCGVGPAAGSDATPDLPARYQKLVRFGDRAVRPARAIFAVESFGWRWVSRLPYARMVASSPAVDRAVLRQKPIAIQLREALRDGFRQGGRACADEFMLLSRPWGFSLADIRCPAVIWHGEQDRLAPVQMARHLAAQLPGARAHIIADAGHFFAFAQPEAVLESLRAVA